MDSLYNLINKNIGGIMLDKIKMEDIPECHRDLVEFLGLDVFKKLVRYMGGCVLYVPLESAITKVIRNRLIRSSFNGNYGNLARKFRMSENQIRRIVKKKE